MAYTDGFVTANGIDLHYLEWAAAGAAAPTVLFTHPTGFHAHVWEPFAEHLAGRYRSIAPDTRGHGDSDKPGAYAWTDFADDLDAFVDALGLTAVIGIGHSAGATTLAAVAARRPGLCNRLVLIEPILSFAVPRVPHSPDAPMSVAARKRRMVWPSRQAAIDSYSGKRPFSTWDRRMLALYVNYGVYDRADGTVVLKCSGEDEAEMYRWGPSLPPPEECLPKIDCPVLLVAGGNSDAFPPGSVRRTAPLIARCETIVFDGASHFVPFERPAEVEATIDRFLQER